MTFYGEKQTLKSPFDEIDRWAFIWDTSYEKLFRYRN